MHDLLVPAALAFAAVTLIVAVLGWLRRRRGGGRSRGPIGGPGEKGLDLGPGDRLRAALARTRDALRDRIQPADEGELGKDYFLAVEEGLLLADVGVRTTEMLVGRMRKEVAPGSTGHDAARILMGLIKDILTEPSRASTTTTRRPVVVLVAGVNGVGKTTTIAKLAARHIRDGRRVLLVGADTFRAAATEQLERWGSRVGSDVVSQGSGADPAAVVVDGLRAARSRGSDVVIVDTAGRLHTRKDLIEELAKIRRVAARECPGAPHETLLVLDATTGQNGLEQARVFKEALDVTGVVITKMDGTARGGVAVSVAAEMGIPIRFLGVGEGPDDLAPFDAGEFVGALFDPEAIESRGREESRVRETASKTV